ncbi:hypothetical protein [uncultured Castellaniella sp.]|uniref:ACP-like domain-containing protein n=1 Tax=uncultured Castellaniella sp. TaxID=647907 RepID=UPI0026141CBA|nr:hypothetical protein [uncultured Castellaniella sp.]
MIKHYLTGAASAALCITLAACSTPTNLNAPNQLAQKTVHYACNAQGQRDVNLEVQYTFQGTDPVTAQVVYDDQAISMTRDTNSKSNLVGATFVGEGYTWTTGQFTVENAEKVNGNMLTRADPAPNRTGEKVNTILARGCAVRAG